MTVDSVATQVAGFFGFGPRKITPERVELLRRDAEKSAEWLRESEASKERWRLAIATPAHEYINTKLGSAGLPPDIGKVNGQNYSFWLQNNNWDWGSAYSGRVIAASVEYGKLVLELSGGPSERFKITYDEDSTWGYWQRIPVYSVVNFQLVN